MVKLNCANHGVLHITDTIYAGGWLICKKCGWQILGNVAIDLSTGDLVYAKSAALDIQLPEKLGITFGIRENKS